MGNAAAGFFKKYGGRRLDVSDRQPIERGMSDEHLREDLAAYQQMLATGARPNGERLTATDAAQIAKQASRFRAEIARRSK